MFNVSYVTVFFIVENAAIVSTSGPPYAEVITLTCKTNYTAVSGSNISACSNGVFAEPSLVCKPVCQILDVYDGVVVNRTYGEVSTLLE